MYRSYEEYMRTTLGYIPIKPMNTIDMLNQNTYHNVTVGDVIANNQMNSPQIQGNVLPRPPRKQPIFNNFLQF